MKLIIITFLFINIYSSVYSNTIYYLTKIPNLKVHDLNSSNGIKYLKAEKSFKVGIVENNVQCNKPSENDIKNKFKIIKKDINNINRLENNLLLIYTGKKRVAQDVAKKYSGKLTTVNKKYIDTMIQHVNEGEKIIKGNNLDDFGKLLHSAWLTKKKLSTHISSTKIDEIYDYVIKNGALGGKLLGAGGGGFFLFYMRGELKESFLKKNKKLVNVPFKFSNRGTEILFKDLKR